MSSSSRRSGKKEALRVLHIAETYPPDYGGGAAIVIQDLCRSLADLGHEVRVLCVDNADGEPYTARVDWDGAVRLDRINLPYFKTQDPDGWRLGLIGWRKHERRIAKVIDWYLSAWKPDLVHYHTARPLGEEALLAIRRSKIPVVAMLHEAWAICPRLMLLSSPKSEPCTGPAPLKCLECIYSHYDGSHWRAGVKLPWRVLKLGIYPVYRLARRTQARRSLDGAVAYSQFMARVHKAHVAGEVRAVQLGLPPALVRRQARQPGQPLRFGFVAGFQPVKGIWHVLDAAASLKQVGLVFELHIWGPNQDGSSDEIAERNLGDRVFLHGMYHSEDIWNIYAKIDVALMATTVCEPFGRVPIEAASVGVPTIAPAIGGITESIRDNIDGLLYTFRDPDHLKHQMRRVLEEPGLVERLARELRRAPDIRNMAAEIEEFYLSMLGRSGRDVPAMKQFAKAAR